MPASIDALLDKLIDYAGLFPPAQLDMDPAVTEFARHLRGPHAGVLSHFICPAWRLGELTRHASMVMPGTFATSGYTEMADVTPPWKVAAIVKADDPQTGLEQVIAFNDHHSDERNGLANIDAIEIKAPSASFIDEALEAMPDDIIPFFEIDHREDPRGMIAALSGLPAAAKIRTGGVTPDLIPTPEEVARFIWCCQIGDVPFKCTAGLHHPLRGDYRLTYEAGSDEGTMFGFLNVFLASAFIRHGKIDEAQAAMLLVETDKDKLSFDDNGASWQAPGGEISLSTDEIIDARRQFSFSYGSCSFTEPTEELAELGWL